MTQENCPRKIIFVSQNATYDVTYQVQQSSLTFVDVLLLKIATLNLHNLSKELHYSRTNIAFHKHLA